MVLQSIDEIKEEVIIFIMIMKGCDEIHIRLDHKTEKTKKKTK